jgi:hypothetical protein
MDISLPHAIETYVRAENAGDVDAMMDCFSPFATVRDGGHLYEGIPAIKNWKTRTREKYKQTVTPLEIRTSDGDATLTAELAGNFAGSPVVAELKFALVDDRIASLRIHN